MHKFFRYDFGFAAASIYAAVVVLANLDKDVETIVWIALRQAVLTFLTASTIVAYVIAVARSEKTMYFKSTFSELYFQQLLLPRRHLLHTGTSPMSTGMYWLLLR